MTTWSQTPGNLNFSIIRGDDFSAPIDASIDMSGYTTSATIQSAVTGGTVLPLTVSVTSASAGQMVVSLTDTQTSSLARGTYLWKMTWVVGGATRTALSGIIEVK